MQPAAKATDITATARITATGTLAVKVKITVAPVSSSPPAPKLPMASDAKLQNAASKDTTVRMLTGGGLNSPSVPMISGGFDLYHAGGSSKDWASGGALAGGTILCFVGAVATFEYGGTGCRPAGKVGAGVGGGVGWGIGFLLGGFNAPGADAFEWGPDQAYTPWAY